MIETLCFLGLGVAIGLLWRLRQWLAYWKAMRNLDGETKIRRAYYEHCKTEAEPANIVTRAPGPMLK